MNYIGIKDFISGYKEPFDAVVKATKKAKQNLKDSSSTVNKQSIADEVAIILEQWKEKQDLGLVIHKKIQDKELEKNPECITTQYIKGEGDTVLDAVQENLLVNNKTYIEKKVVSNHHGLIGYADIVRIENNYINIEDIKTFRKVYRTSSYTAPNGFKIAPKYFYSPIDNLQDTNFNECALQVSLYMYILWTHNKKLKPGSLILRHIILNDNNTIIKEDPIPLPYLREEVKAIIKQKKINEN